MVTVQPISIKCPARDHACAAWQAAYAPAFNKLTGAEGMLDFALTAAAGLCDQGLLDMHSASSWRGEYVYQASQHQP